MPIRCTRLTGGVRVVTEEMPGARSVATGFWVGVGARDEAPEEAGASHFLEHLLFKGTEARTAAQIAEAVDAVGGEMNAFTAHEHTAYYTRLPAPCLDLGLDLLSDVCWTPAFRLHEVEAERRVILEEIGAEEDCPEDRVLSLLAETLFPGHPLGAEVLGTRRSVAAMGRERIQAFHRRWYRPAAVVVAAAGRLQHGQVVEGVARRFAGLEGGEAPDRRPPERSPGPLAVVRRQSEQAHVAVGVRALASHDDDRYALAVANQVLGGGVSSRLFQIIREERGWAYSVYSYLALYADTGALVAYAGTSPGRVPEVLAVIRSELDRMAAQGVSEQELRVATGYLEGATVLGAEDSVGRMSRMATAMMAHGEVAELDEVVARYRAVTLDDVRRVVDRVLGTATRTVAVVGPVEPAGVGSAMA
ncbi:MAG: M16 family metallopeptidase [Acidimicrobiales bacterium]